MYKMATYKMATYLRWSIISFYSTIFVFFLCDLTKSMLRHRKIYTYIYILCSTLAHVIYMYNGEEKKNYTKLLCVDIYDAIISISLYRFSSNFTTWHTNGYIKQDISATKKKKSKLSYNLI